MPRRRRPTSLPPDMVRFVMQNGQDSDCAVATIGTLFGKTRDEALAICAVAAPRVLEDGMADAEVDRALAIIGVPYQRLQPGQYDLHDATGMLTARGKGEMHFVFLWAGRIIEGNGEHWLDPDDYLAHYKMKACELLVRAD